MQPKIRKPKIKWRAPVTLKRTRKTWLDTWRLLTTLTLQQGLASMMTTMRRSANLRVHSTCSPCKNLNNKKVRKVRNNLLWVKKPWNPNRTLKKIYYKTNMSSSKSILRFLTSPLKSRPAQERKARLMALACSTQSFLVTGATYFARWSQRMRMRCLFTFMSTKNCWTKCSTIFTLRRWATFLSACSTSTRAYSLQKRIMLT